MSLKLCFIVDPIETFDVKKDSTLAMMLEAQNRGFDIFYTTIQNLYIIKNKAFLSLQKFQKPCQLILL